MSTMYYTYPEKKPIGQVHSLGSNKGFHFTWCMYPSEFAQFMARETPHIIDEYGNVRDCAFLESTLLNATSQSFDERIE